MIDTLTKEHLKIFNRPYEHIFFSPGRINLIGEHIDYNGGLVFPMAINLGTYGVVSLREDRKVALFSHDFTDEIIYISIDDLEKESPFWTHYIKGMIHYLKEKHSVIQGFNLYIYGTIPNGAGLSSSASLELLTGVIVRELNGLDISNIDLALMGKKVENEYIGLNSGIMDQFSVAMGKKDYAMLLNTENLEYQYAPFDLGDNVLIVGFTHKKRSLADSKYNERFSECRESLKILNEEAKYAYLVDVPLSVLEKNKQSLGPILYKRVKHVITEQQRTKDIFKALQNKDIQKVASLLIEGHRSLQFDYEVSGIELDTLVDEFLKQGALGARQTGAGFGGCMFAMVPKQKVKNVLLKVEQAYKETIGYSPSFFEVYPSDGAGLL